MLCCYAYIYPLHTTILQIIHCIMKRKFLPNNTNVTLYKQRRYFFHQDLSICCSASFSVMISCRQHFLIVAVRMLFMSFMCLHLSYHSQHTVQQCYNKHLDACSIQKQWDLFFPIKSWQSIGWPLPSVRNSDRHYYHNRSSLTLSAST